jgi:predicted secreted protein
MDPLLAAAAWFILWWLCFFVMLPIGVRSIDEEGQTSPGLDPGAPSRPNLAKKALWAAGLATGLWIALILVLNAVYYDR